MNEQRKLHHRSSSKGPINSSELIKSLRAQVQQSLSKIKLLEDHITNLVAMIHEKDALLEALKTQNQQLIELQGESALKTKKAETPGFPINILAQSIEDITNVDQNELNIKNRMESMKTFEINKMPTLFQRSVGQNRSVERLSKVVSHSRILQLKPENIATRQMISPLGIISMAEKLSVKEKPHPESSFKLFENFLVVTGNTAQLNNSTILDARIVYSYPEQLSNDKEKTIPLFCFPNKVECCRVQADQRRQEREQSFILVLNSEFTTNNKMNKTVAAVNPNHYLFGVCLQTYSTVKIQSHIYKVPTIYVILTYFPFVKFFIEVLSLTLKSNRPQNGALINERAIMQGLQSLSQLRINSFPVTLRYHGFGRSNTFSLPEAHHIDTLALSYANSCLPKLDPSILSDLLLYFLLQYSIVIYSSSSTLLSQVILFLLQIIKPLKYPYPVIVNLPSQMQLMLDSPFPCLLGLTTKIDLCLQQSHVYFDLDAKVVYNRAQLPQLHYVFDYVRNSIKSKYAHQNQLIKKLRYIIKEEILNGKEKHSVMGPFLERFKSTQIYRYYNQ